MQVRCLSNSLHWISTFFCIWIQTLNLALHQPASSLPCASLQSHLRPSSPPFLLHSLSQAPKQHSYRGHHCHCTLWRWATAWPWVGPATLDFRVLKGLTPLPSLCCKHSLYLVNPSSSIGFYLKYHFLEEICPPPDWVFLLVIPSHGSTALFLQIFQGLYKTTWSVTAFSTWL